MAKKSAKNKKALRRKQEARKRSRVVRQDYTVGGRVKAFNGLPDGVQEAIDAGKRAEEEARRLQAIQAEEAKKDQEEQLEAEETTPLPLIRKEQSRPLPILPKELTPVIVEEPPRIMGEPTPPTRPLFQDPVIISDPKEEFTTPKTVKLPDETILDLGTGETTPEVSPEVDTPEQQVLNFGTRYDGKEFTSGNYDRINKDGGDSNQDKVITNDEWVNWMLTKGPDEGVSEQGIPFKTFWEEKLTEASRQGDLRDSTRERLNQRLDADVEDTTDTFITNEEGEEVLYDVDDLLVNPAVASAGRQAEGSTTDSDATPYVDNRLAAINDPANKNDYFNSDSDNLITKTVNDYLGHLLPDKFTPEFNEQENAILNLNMGNWNSAASNSRPAPFIEIYSGSGPATDSTVSISPAYTTWRSKKANHYNSLIRQIVALKKVQDGEEEYGRRILPVSKTPFSDKTKVPYEIPAASAAKVEATTVSKLSASDYETDSEGKFKRDEAGDLIPLDRPGISADTFQTDRFERDADGNIQFDENGNPIRALRDVAPISEDDVGVADIDVDKVESTERQLTDPSKVATNAELLGVDPKAVRGFLVAEANYFNKYPEVRDALRRGEATDLFDYQRRIGSAKGYTLDFDSTEYATGTADKLAEASEAALTSTRAAVRDPDQEEEALATEPRFVEDTRSKVDPITGATIILSPTPEAEKQSRAAILDEKAAQGTEALIQGTLGYEAAEKRALKGEAAKGDARSLLQEVGEIPPDIAEAILDNPVSITAQIDTTPVEVQAAIAALPNEALVSVQLENLLAGMDEGVTPTWARPAVQLVESQLSARGLNVSTVGRDALFNAIIQTSLPIAQSNAAALQQRAAQNLSNEQQANLQQASQEMQLRLTNLANRQDSGSQTAQLAQQINLTQGQFTQQSQVTQSEQAQQVRLQSLQNEQQAAMANLGNDQQIELANLQIEAERLGANQSAINQEKLAEMTVAANFLQRNAEFKQQMEVANLSNEQQMRLSYLTAKNQASSENLNAAQQTELANLSKKLEVNKITANLAQQMNLAQLNVDQQTAIQNAATVANIDLTKFSSAQQIELSNSKFMQTSTLQDLNNRQQVILQDATALASMELQGADSLTKVSIENARNFLSMEMGNLNTEQQSYILDSQQEQQRMLTDAAVQNSVRQFNSSSDLQTQQFVTSLAGQLNQFNSQQVNALQQFNSTEKNRAAALDAGNELQSEQFMSQLQTQIKQFNSQQDLQIEQFNTSNAQAIEQANVEWRRKANLADSAATNAANQQQAQNQFNLDSQAQSQAWQSLRDQAAFDMNSYESDKARKISAINALLSNEAFMTSTNTKYTDQRTKLLNSLDSFSDSIQETDFELEII